MTLRLVRDEQPSDADQQSIRDRLDGWNVVVTGRDDWYPVAIYLRDEEGGIRGGVLGDIWASWLHVKFLWVDEDCRGNGWGVQLLESAEAYARERGCVSAHLDTFSFQAGPGFYRRLGYEVFGVLEDHPPGYTHHFMWKVLK